MGFNSTTKRKSSKKVMPLETTLTRSLNGKPVTHDEMKSRSYRSDAFNQVLVAVNERINRPHAVAPNDNDKNNS
jgi:hypothetical protein